MYKVNLEVTSDINPTLLQSDTTSLGQAILNALDRNGMKPVYVTNTTYDYNVSTKIITISIPIVSDEPTTLYLEDIVSKVTLPGWNNLIAPNTYLKYKLNSIYYYTPNTQRNIKLA
ncbi:Hypothetical protein ORPV_132 [Orpheovirus IHUMI-LCC2]|uniref:Uncharacterized protein n=1 Tax=Orpheovirus IHUMI-LCC2 TaxID=2023057 RepID=A0A2I2L3D2_9VIRU|nr:Hypothetical protein ORPV_132 [Orpheovirus IHUMI-LCC2]SNW62036.1 Hypothetical protein ORPV_132 [Orpheovirus IHUMI-LCC2]